MSRRIATDETRVLDFLRQAETGNVVAPPARARKVRSHAEKFFDGPWQSGAMQANSSDWQTLGFGTGSPRGGFEGGRFDRATEDWNPGDVGPNRAQLDARVMRARARDLVRNNPHAAAAVDAWVSNVIERGITPKPKFDDDGRRDLWETQWKIWGGLLPWAMSQADITGVDTIYGLQALWLREIVIAGGCLLHFVELPLDRANGRTIPLAIELIPEERFCQSHDNFLMPGQTNPKTKNPIINGVEIDPATGRHLAYWVYPSLPGDAPQGAMEPLRLPANQCVYGFMRRRAGENRGYSLLHGVITWLWHLGFYTNNEMFASSLKSNWAYMITTDDDENIFEMASDGDETYAADMFGNRLDKLTPGMVWRGRAGDDIKPVGPNVPQAESMPWINLIERSISMGSHLSVSELTRDYSQSNFSNTRAAANGDRKRFRAMQDFAVAKCCNPTWFRFVSTCVRMGFDGFPRPSQFASTPEDWLRVNHRAPGWATVNPRDDSEAAQIDLAIGATTLEKICADRGEDWEHNLEQRAKELAKAESLGLNISVDSTNATADPAEQAEVDGNEADASGEDKRSQQQDGAPPSKAPAKKGAPK